MNRFYPDSLSAGHSFFTWILSLIESKSVPATWRLLVLSVAVVGSMNSMAFGQRTVGGSSYMQMQMYMRQMNQQNAAQTAAQKNAILGEANALADQSTKTVDDCEKNLSKLRTEQTFATSRVENSEKALAETESEIRAARKQRTEQEESILASQDGESVYQVALKAQLEANEVSIKNVERILNHPVKDGNPQRLGSLLKKGEFKLLEDDKSCAAAFHKYSQSKDKLDAEVKRLISGDKVIAKIDETIKKLQEDQKRQKAELSTARATQKKTKNEVSRYTTALESAKNDLDSAQQVIAQLGGKRPAPTTKPN